MSVGAGMGAGTLEVVSLAFVSQTSNSGLKPRPSTTAPAVRLSMKRLVSKVPDPGVAETDSLVSRLVWIGHVFS